MDWTRHVHTADFARCSLHYLDLPKVVFVGHSLGGLLAMRFANRHWGVATSQRGLYEAGTADD
jgi:pimeloyl-ACP methyl ester carboxylesterase